VSFFEEQGRRNRIYVSSQSGLKAGVFPTELEGVVLTKEGECRSRWLLAEEFESLFLDRGLSYHPDEARWRREGKRIALQTVGRGQEFVLDGKRHPAVHKYFVDRIKAASSTKQCSHEF
jgi:Nucleotide modification associated domain 3